MMADLRAAEAGDIGEITAIYAHHVVNGTGTFEEVPPTAEEMHERFRALVAAHYPFLVAVERGRIVGYAYGGPFRPRSAYRSTIEDSVYVREDRRGGSIGKCLLGELAGRAEAQGFRQMIAVIGDSGNAASISLHQSCGFTRMGVLPAIGYKHGRWVDAVLMQRALGVADAQPPADLVPSPSGRGLG